MIDTSKAAIAPMSRPKGRRSKDMPDGRQALLIAATVMMVFTVLLEQSSLYLRPRFLAIVGMVPMVLVLCLGVWGVVSGVRCRREAEASGESAAFGGAATLASLVGTAAWLTATIYLGVVLSMK